LNTPPLPQKVKRRTATKSGRLGSVGRPHLALRMIGLVCVAVLAFAGRVAAQERPPDVDHAIVFELGAEGDWSKADGFHPGGTLAFEITPIENWLELEFGVSVTPHPGGVEIPVDVLFKKPWRISRTVEFMAGIGPELIHSSVDHQTFWGLSAVGDLMVWPTRNVGWYLEPGIERTFQPGEHRTGLAMAAGLIVGR
jgi:hypothetical protein